MEALRPLGAPPANRGTEEDRVEWYLQMLRKFEEGRLERVWGIVTDNETVVYYTSGLVLSARQTTVCLTGGNKTNPCLL